MAACTVQRATPDLGGAAGEVGQHAKLQEVVPSSWAGVISHMPMARALEVKYSVPPPRTSLARLPSQQVRAPNTFPPADKRCTSDTPTLDMPLRGTGRCR